jgi:hypothetical protein
MGTSPAVKNKTVNVITTGNRVGKSIFSSNPMSVWFDDFETTVMKDQKKDEPIQFHFDTLALACEAHLAGKNGTEIFSLIQAAHTQKPMPNISNAAYKHAETVRKYFRNKMMIRTLKGEHMSEYMTSLTEFLDTENNLIKKKHVPILVKLPKFYDENTQTETVFKQYVSLAEKGGELINDSFRFVTQIHRQSKNQNFHRFYFANSRKQLLTFTLTKNEMGFKLWNYIAQQQDSIKIKARVSKHNIPGYDFIMYHLSNDYEILE